MENNKFTLEIVILDPLEKDGFSYCKVNVEYPSPEDQYVFEECVLKTLRTQASNLLIKIRRDT